MKEINNISLTLAFSKANKFEVVSSHKSTYYKALAVLFSGYLITACSSVQVNDETAINDTPPQQEQSVSTTESKPDDKAPTAEPAKSATKPAQVEAKTAKPAQSKAAAKPAQEKAAKAAKVEAEKTQAADTKASSPKAKAEPKLAAVAPVAEKKAPKIEKKTKVTFTSSSKSTPKDAMKWVIERNWDSKNPARCRISSPTFQVHEHDYATQVWLDVEDQKLHVNTTIHIDIKKPGVGIKPGNGSLQKFSSMPTETSAIWSGDLLSTLNAYNKLVIFIGGGDLGKHIQKAEVKLDGLKAVYSEYLACKD